MVFHAFCKTADTFTKTLDTLPRTVAKGKAIPVQVWTGPEDSRRLRLSDFQTIGT